MKMLILFLRDTFDPFDLLQLLIEKCDAILKYFWLTSPPLMTIETPNGELHSHFFFWIFSMAKSPFL